MKIKWLGHASFALTTSQGQIILTDPYEMDCYGGALKYPKITTAAQVVSVSHTQHPDHFCRALPGNPRIIDKEGDYEVAGIKIKGIPAFHDARQGKERGKNTIFLYKIDDMTIAHLGDLGHIPTKDQYTQIGPVDILFIPVGGYFTIDANEATQIAKDLKARVVIPMHYKTDLVEFPIASVEPFLKDKPKVKKLNTPEATVDKASLPAESEVWVFPYQKRNGILYLISLWSDTLLLSFLQEL